MEYQPKKYWIKFIHYYCPLCGKEETFQERIPLPKPKDYLDRHEVIENYDWCGIDYLP